MFLRGLPRLRAIVLPALIALAAVGCGGENKPSPPGTGTPPPSTGSPPPAGNAIPVRGTERIGWTQAAASVAELRSYSFRIYVDNTGSAIADVQCSETASTEGYPCTGRLPMMALGRHTLELTAVVGSSESARSAPLTVERIAPAQTGDATATDADALSPADDGLGHLTIAELRAVTAMSAAPDGRLFVVEDGRHVRVIANDVLVAAPALSIDPRAARLVGIAVDAAFAATRSVFVAWTSGIGVSSAALHITRYRELNNALGEGATIVTGVPVRPGASVPLAMDVDGLLYVAVPGDTVGPAARSVNPYSASVLRFTRDGYVPASNPRASPILAAGYSLPTGIALDVRRQRLWLSGRDPMRQHAVASVALDDAEGSWPAEPLGTAVPDSTDVTLALVGASAIDAPMTLVIGAAGHIHRSALDERGYPEGFHALAELNIVNPVIAPAADPEKGLYVAGVIGGVGAVVRIPNQQ